MEEFPIDVFPVDENRLANDFAIVRQLGADDKGGITRLAYEYEEQVTHDYVAEQAQAVGAKAEVDSVGNLTLTLHAATPPKTTAGKRQRIVMASHVDSVPNGGNYDGVLGVLGGLEVLRNLAKVQSESTYRLNHDVALVVFRAEESARFNQATVGSAFALGVLGPETLHELVDKQGITAFAAMKKAGFRPDLVGTDCWDPEETLAYLELHIEQGPVLETTATPIGVVTGIGAPVRYEFTIKGRKDHSGATPMDMRRDALDAFIEMGSRKQAVMSALPSGSTTVCTIGDVLVPNGSMNVIPGETQFLLDLRDINEAARNHVEEQLLAAFREVAESRNVEIAVTEKERKPPCQLPESLQAHTQQICERRGIAFRSMPSGPGHDGLNVQAKGIPVGMVFVPSVNGISHAKDEFTSKADCARGASVLGDLVLRVDRQ